MPFPKLRHWRDWRIAAKLTILFSTTTVLLLIVFTIVDDVRLRSQIIDQARIRNLQKARATAGILDFYLAEVDANMQLIAVAPGTTEFLISQLHDVYHDEILQVLRLARERGGYDAVFLLDPTGNVLIATNDYLVGRNYTTALWFRNAAAGRTMFDEPRYDAVDGKVYLHVSAPVTTLRGQVIGAAVARLTLEPIDRIITADLNYDGLGAFGILGDENGIPLGHPLRPDLRFQPLAPIPSDLFNVMVFESRFGPDTARILNNASHLDEVVRRGKQLLYDSQTDPYVSADSIAAGPADFALAPLKNKRWVYAVGSPQANLLAQVNEQTLANILQATWIGVLGLLASVVVARWITRPIGRVAEGANAIANGDLSRRIALRQRDEIGQLADAFNAMAKTLEQEDTLLHDYTERLEETNKELEAFSYSVSHDLRAPLRHIDGFSKALAQDYADRLDERGRRYLRLVSESAQRMNQLIDDLLQLSRITRTEMRFEEFDLSALAQSVADALLQAASERRIEFVIAPGLTAMGDPRLIRIALENLIGNACKFTGKTPEPRIQVGTTSNHTLPNGDRLASDATVFFVQDNGAGFDMAYQQKLFGVFQRLHNENDFPGTGIGLATVKRIILRHGGHVWAEGYPGQGATFYFVLGVVPSMTHALH